MPTPTQPLHARLTRIPALLPVVTALFASLLVGVTSQSASAGTPGTAAVTEASHHNGKPYAYGATGPTRFDCSGFTLYVFSRFGKRLPHNSTDQYRVTPHIAKTSKRPGDLIFTRSSSGRIYHVGVYAGNNKIWHSPKTGDRVHLSSIWTTNYVVARVA